MGGLGAARDAVAQGGANGIRTSRLPAKSASARYRSARISPRGIRRIACRDGRLRLVASAGAFNIAIDRAKPAKLGRTG